MPPHTENALPTTTPTPTAMTKTSDALWVTFTSCTRSDSSALSSKPQPGMKSSSGPLQIHVRTAPRRHNVSPIIRQSATGCFTTPVTCLLSATGSHQVSVRKLRVAATAASRLPHARDGDDDDDDGVDYTTFVVDANALSRRLSQLQQQEEEGKVVDKEKEKGDSNGLVRCTVSASATAPNGSVLVFTASRSEPTCADDASDARPISTDVVTTTAAASPPTSRKSGVQTANAGAPELSFSSVSEDDYGGGDDWTVAVETGARRRRSSNGVVVVDDGDDDDGDDDDGDATPSKRVSFNERVARIPTTEMLQREAEAAGRDRALLWHGVSDLSVQLANLRREVSALRVAAGQRTGGVIDDDDDDDTVVEDGSPALSCVSVVDSPSASRNTTCSTLMSSSSTATTKRRRAVLDGDMIAEAYGDGVFRAEGIQMAVDYFVKRGVHAVAIVSESRVREGSDVERRRIRHMRDRRIVSTCPSHRRRGAFLLRYALDHQADIVSNLWMVGSSSMGSRSSIVQSGDGGDGDSEVVDGLVTRFMFIGDRFVPDGKVGGGRGFGGQGCESGLSRRPSSSPACGVFRRSGTL